MAKTDLVFVCGKCEHNLYISEGVSLTGKQIANKLKQNCPNCGEEAGDYWRGLWIYTRLGNYDKEYGVEEPLSKGEKGGK